MKLLLYNIHNINKQAENGLTMIFKTKDRTKELLDLIWCDDYYIVAAKESAPSEKELKIFSKEHGVKFPKEYLAHSSNYFGGFYLEIKEHIWPRAKLFDVAPFWTFLYGFITYSFNKEAPEWMSIEIATLKFKEMGHNVIPVLKVLGDADVYCINESSQIVKWSHEDNIFEPFHGNFFDLLEYELKELENRRKMKIEVTESVKSPS